MEKGKGIGGSETLQQEEVDRFRGSEGLGFVNKKVEVQFRMDRLIHELVAAKKKAGAAQGGEDRAPSGERSKGQPSEGSLKELLGDDGDEEYNEDFVQKNIKNA